MLLAIDLSLILGFVTSFLQSTVFPKTSSTPAQSVLHVSSASASSRLSSVNAAAAITLSSGVSVSPPRFESIASTSLAQQVSATSSSSSSSTVLPASGTTSEPVSKAAIAGGVVGCFAAAVLVCLLLFFLRRRGREKQRRAATVSVPGYLPHEEDISAHGGTEVIGQLKGTPHKHLHIFMHYIHSFAANHNI